MARIKRYMGSIFARGGKLYVKIKNDDGTWVQRATGLADTKSNRLGLRVSLEQGDHERYFPTQSPFTFGSLFEEYKTHCFHTHTHFTQLSYKSSWKCVFLDVWNEPITLQTIIREVRKQSKKGGKAISIKTRLSTIQAIFRWAEKALDMPAVPPLLRYCSLPKTEQHKNIAYTHEECVALFMYFADRDMQMATILAVMFQTGARITETIRLQEEQVLPHGIMWKNKITHQKEYVPCSQDVLEMLRSMPTKQGKYFTYSRDMVAKRLRRAAEELGIELEGKRILHSFRKTFANAVFSRADIPLADQLKLVRHRTIDVTIKHYLQENEERLKSFADTISIAPKLHQTFFTDKNNEKT